MKRGVGCVAGCVSQVINIIVLQKELWLLALSFMTAVVELAGIIVFDPSFVWDCKCRQGHGTGALSRSRMDKLRG